MAQLWTPMRIILSLGLLAGLATCKSVPPERPPPPPGSSSRPIPVSSAQPPAIASPPPAMTQPLPVEPEPLVGWRADVRAFSEQVPRMHPDAFHTLPREQFHSAVGALGEALAGMKHHEIIVELARIAAGIGDGAATLHWATPRFHCYPIRYYLFSEGLYVIAADPAYAAVVGGRVVTLGSLPVEDAYYKVAQAVSRDNAMQLKWLTPNTLTIAQVLSALGAAEDMESVPLTVEKNGVPVTVHLRPEKSLAPVQFEVSLTPPRGWADARKDAKHKTPLWLRDSGNMFWSEKLPKERTLYVQFNRIFDKQNEKLADFFDGVLREMDRGPFDRLVIDLRRNSFGDHALIPPIWHTLRGSKKLDTPGRLFVLIGRNTFSAAMSFVNQMSLHTRAIFAGEPTGGRPNHFASGRPLDLPHLHAWIVLPPLRSEDIPGDDRLWHAPDIPVELSFADYRDNVDPVMRAVLRFR